MHFKGKNCAKSGNSKYSTINQMSYMQKFFDQHLSRFYLDELRQHLQHPSFAVFSNQHNIFVFTLDLILLPKSCFQSEPDSKKHCILVQFCKVSYEELRDVRLPVKQQDNDIVKLLKTSLKYVHMQMLQILIRLVLCFYESLTTNTVNDTLSTLIDEISLIYPALKIQISFSHPEINLCQFFEQILTKITQSFLLNEVSTFFLQQIADKAEFIGPLQKLFKKYTQNNTRQVIQCDSKATLVKNGKQSLGKTNQSSNFSTDQETKAQKRASKQGQKLQKFDELQLFRSKKRKLIMKQRLKQLESGCKTPYRSKEISHSNTPKSNKTQQLVVRSDTTQKNASSILYRRLIANKACPIPQRTLYFGQMHKFLPKKSASFDPQLFIQNITASSLTNDYSNPFEQVSKKTERKISKFIAKEKQDHNIFCVPQTPKPEPIRKHSNLSLLNADKKPSKV